MSSHDRAPQALELNPFQESRLQLYEILWRRKAIIFLTTCVGLGLGYWYYLEAPRVFESSSIVLIKTRQTAPMVSREMQLVSEDKMETQLQIASSQAVLSKAAEDEQLRKLELNDTAGSLAGGVKAEVVKNSEAIAINFKSHDPNHAQQSLMAIVKAYEAFLKKSYHDVGQETFKLIEEASTNLKEEIKGERKKYEDFRALHAKELLLVDGQLANVNSQRLASLLNQKNDLTTKQMRLETEIKLLRSTTKNGVDKSTALDVLAKLDQLAGGAILGVKDDIARNMEKTTRDFEEMTKLFLEERTLRSKFGEDHPLLKDVRDKIELLTEMHSKMEEETQKDLESQITSMNSRNKLIEIPTTPEECVKMYDGMLERDLERIKADLASLEGEIATAKDMSEKIDILLVEEDSLSQKIAQAELLNKQIVDRLAEIDIIKDSGGTRAIILNPPTAARQVAPVLFQILAISGVAGLALGVGIGYLLEIGEGTFRSPGDVVRSLDLQILGQVPSIESRRVKRAATLSKIPQTIIAAHQPSSSVAEAFRAIRTALYFSGEGKGHQVIQVTSPTPGDGKSTLSANLAVSIAKSGKSVLLIDADFRRPTQHRIFGVSNDYGLANVLVNTTDEIRPADTEIANLSLLPSGPGVQNPSELLSGLRMGEALETLRTKYDFLIIDTPPVLAVTDPLAVAARVDGVILAIRISKGIQFSSKRARESLDRVGAHILGVVVNGFSRGSAFAQGVAKDYGYGHGYGYGYGYGYSRNPYADPYSRREEITTTSTTSS